MMNVHLMLTLLNVPNGVVAATETPVTAGGVGKGVGVDVGGVGVGVFVGGTGVGVSVGGTGVGVGGSHELG